MEPTKHDKLVERAVKWLRNSATEEVTYGNSTLIHSCKCAVVLAEPCSICAEQPDAIGWWHSGRLSILIECKVTKADFIRDLRKWFRHRGYFGMGRRRYYMTPKGLLQMADLPDGWGLLECHGRATEVIRYSDVHEYSVGDEMAVLWSECRKIQIAERGGKLPATKAGERIKEAVG